MVIWKKSGTKDIYQWAGYNLNPNYKLLITNFSKYMDLGATGQSAGNYNVDITSAGFIDVFIYLILAVIFVFLVAAALKLLRNYLLNIRHHRHTVLLIRLPKEKPGDKDKEFTVQQLREEIAHSEAILSSIGGLKAERGFNSWLFGRSDIFALELVADRKLISYYLVAPEAMGRYVEQQIHAHFPDALVERTDDYNIFRPESETAAGFVKTKRSFIFPLKTYQKQETDPMNSLINVMSKLDENEGMAIQFVIRSAVAGWHRKASLVPHQVRQGKTIEEAIRLIGAGKYFAFFSDLVKSAKPDKRDAMQKQYEPVPRLTAMEEEMLKGIEEKNSRAGLDVNIRVVVSADSRGKAVGYLNNIMNAFGQYNYYQYGNSFKARISGHRQKRVVSDFIFRRFDPSLASLLNTEELASLYHLPLRETETPNIRWLTAKHAPPPADIPDEGILLGNNTYRGVTRDIRIKRDDRRRHMYVIGKSGTGKSQFMAGMAIQDIMNGEGVCVIDPHGDLIADVLERIPPERAEDVILFSPADLGRPLAMNLLEFDPRYPEQKTFMINEMIKIFDKLYDLKATGGPIFEQYIRNAMLLIMSDPATGSTLMEIPKVLADPDFRRMKLERCGDPTVVDFWNKEAEKAGGDAALANVVPYVTSKLTAFISNDMMRPIIGQQQSSFNLRELMDRQKILLVDLPKGQVGEMNAYLLGMIIVGKILVAALSRTDMPRDERKDFYLYIDEFQNFTTDSITAILSEARKYNLNLTIAHQYLGQLVKGQDSSIRDAVFGNVGTWALFKIGSEDAEVMAKEFSPVFNQYDLINIDKYTVYLKLLIDNSASRPFSMASLWPLPGTPRPEIARKIRTLSRLKYGQDRELVEAEIMKRVRLEVRRADR